MKSVATDAATRTRALQRAAEVGAAQASRETGVPAGTIRSWMARDADARALTVDSGSDTERIRRIADKARRMAEMAIDRMHEIIPTSKNPQALSIAIGVLLDKAQQLSDSVLALEERDRRLAEADAKVIFEALKLCMGAVDLPFSAGSSISRVFADVLRQLGAGSVAVVSPATAEAARAEIRRMLRDELEAEIRQQVEVEVRARLAADEREAAVSRPPRLALPPAGGTSEQPVSPMAQPRKAWVSTRGPRSASSDVSVPRRRPRWRRDEDRYGESEFS